MTWWAIAGLAAGTYAMRAAGPLLLGGRTLPQGVQRAFGLLAVALLAALTALSTMAVGNRLHVDGPLVAGVAVAGIAVWRRAPFVVVVVAGAAVAALLRLI